MGRVSTSGNTGDAPVDALTSFVQDRADFERLLAGISERMGEISHADFLSGVEQSLTQLNDYLGYERCTFAEFVAGDYLNVLCSVGAGDVAAVPRGRFHLRLPWFHAQLRAGRVVQFAALPDDLPPAAAEEIAHVRAVGLASHLSIPLHVAGRVTGVLSFGAFQQSLRCPDEIATRLKMVGQFLAGAVALARQGEEVRQLRQRIWHADRVQRVSMLSAAIAHQINQPLTAILSNAQAGLRYLDRGNAQPKVMREVLEAVEREEKRAAQTIRTMRALLKRDDTQCERFELASALDDVLRLLSTELLAQGIRVETRFDRTCHVSGDQTQLEQVVLNLISNAASAMQGCQPLDRRIVVGVAHSANGKVVVTVRDAGHGIAAKDLQTIFEPFWTTRQDGLGLGLAICRSIVEAHRGRIWGESTLGQGTTFHVELPRSVADGHGVLVTDDAASTLRLVADLDALDEPLSARTEEQLVCVVDDDPGVRDALVRLLGLAGWATTTYSSADEFLQRPPQGEVGCVLLDIRMPGASGLELQQRLIDAGPCAAPIIFISGHCDVAAGIEAMKLGAADFLEKPVDGEVLLAAVARACERQAAVRAQGRVLDAAKKRLGMLSAREREIVGHVVKGRLNKQIAADLQISEQTVKQHRGRVMEKMGVRSVADLVRACEAAGLESPTAASPLLSH